MEEQTQAVHSKSQSRQLMVSAEKLQEHILMMNILLVLDHSVKMVHQIQQLHDSQQLAPLPLGYVIVKMVVLRVVCVQQQKQQKQQQNVVISADLPLQNHAQTLLMVRTSVKKVTLEQCHTVAQTKNGLTNVVVLTERQHHVLS